MLQCLAFFLEDVGSYKKLYMYLLFLYNVQRLPRKALEIPTSSRMASNIFQDLYSFSNISSISIRTSCHLPQEGEKHIARDLGFQHQRPGRIEGACSTAGSKASLIGVYEHG